MSFLASLTVEQWFFYPLAALTVLSALGVVLAKSPLYGALSMICSFFFLAALFVLLGASFVGILQIIVYAGAIMVLFLFVIMLLSLDARELGRPRVTLFKVAGSAAAVGLVGIAVELLRRQKGAALQFAAEKLPETFGTVAEVGRSLFTEHLVQFEAVSLLLLVAIAGAVVVAKGRI